MHKIKTRDIFNNTIKTIDNVRTLYSDTVCRAENVVDSYVSIKSYFVAIIYIYLLLKKLKQLTKIIFCVIMPQFDVRGDLPLWRNL